MLLFTMLPACTYLPPTTSVEPDGWQDVVKHRKQLTAWNLSGRLGVQSENNGGSLDLLWKQHGEDYTIRLVAPMGQGAVLIRGGEHGVTVKTSEGEEYAEDADALLGESLGVEVPVSALRDWLRGLPMQGAPASELRWDAQGQLAKLVQAQWSIEMSQYRRVDRYMLPHAFYLGRNDRPELAVRLVITHWRLGPT